MPLKASLKLQEHSSEPKQMICAVKWRVWGTDHGTRTAEMRLLRRRTVAAELPDPARFARFTAVVNDHVIVAAVVISLHVELLERQLYYLTATTRTRVKECALITRLFPCILRLCSKSTIYETTVETISSLYMILLFI